MFVGNISEVMDYAVEVEVFNTADFMQEIMSPTFIILASCVAVATLIVILLISLICRKICHTKTGYSVPSSQVLYIFLDPFPISHTYFCILPPQMALLRFFHFTLSFVSPVTR